MNNGLKTYLTRARWIKRIVPRKYLPETCYVSLESGLKVFISPRDVAGPSFHLAYGKEEGFINYEEGNKRIIASQLNNGDVFFDIGANIGLFSLYLKQQYKNLECFLFEPFPTLYKCLNFTKEKSGIENFHVSNLALCNADKDLELFVDTFNDGGHSLNSSSISGRSKKGGSVKTPGRKFDTFIEENKINRVDFIKVDIQGAEVEFLKGAKGSIKKFSPKMMVELNNKNLEEFIKIIHNELGMNYVVYCPFFDENLDLSNLKEFKEKLMSAGREEEDYFFFPASLN